MLHQESTQNEAPVEDPGPAIEFKSPTALTAMFVGLFLLCLVYGFLA